MGLVIIGRTRNFSWGAGGWRWPRLNDDNDSQDIYVCVYICMYVCMYDPLITTLMNFQTSILRFASLNVKHRDKFVSFGMCMRFFK